MGNLVQECLEKEASLIVNLNSGVTVLNDEKYKNQKYCDYMTGATKVLKKHLLRVNLKKWITWKIHYSNDEKEKSITNQDKRRKNS